MLLHLNIMGIFPSLDRGLKCNTRRALKDSFDKALDGYDVGLSNPIGSGGDPAIKGRIFDIFCTGNGNKNGHYNFVTIEAERQCDRMFEKSVSTSFLDKVTISTTAWRSEIIFNHVSLFFTVFNKISSRESRSQ